jgi:hypothetical protein
MRVLDKLKAYARVMRSAKRPLEVLRLLRRRPALLIGVNAYELALLASSRVDTRLKALIGCPF